MTDTIQKTQPAEISPKNEQTPKAPAQNFRGRQPSMSNENLPVQLAKLKVNENIKQTYGPLSGAKSGIAWRNLLEGIFFPCQKLSDTLATIEESTLSVNSSNCNTTVPAEVKQLLPLFDHLDEEETPQFDFEFDINGDEEESNKTSCQKGLKHQDDKVASDSNPKNKSQI